MIPIFITVVVMPLIAGKIPHIKNPANHKKKSFFHSFFIWVRFFFIFLNTNGNKIRKAKNHLQNASETGGTSPAAPLVIAT